MWDWIKLALGALVGALKLLSWKNRKERMEADARDFEQEVQEGVSSIPKPELDSSKNSNDPMGYKQFGRPDDRTGN